MPREPPAIAVEVVEAILQGLLDADTLHVVVMVPQPLHQRTKRTIV